jgi:capsular polysaccharide biosynthesis protein
LLLALIASPILLKFTHPTYVATSQIAFVGNPQTAVLPPDDLPTFVYSQPVLQRVATKLDWHGSLDEIASAANVKTSPHSDVVPIAVHSKDPSTALAIANALADATVEEYRSLSSSQYAQLATKLKGQLSDLRLRISALDARLHTAANTDSYAGSGQELQNISARIEDLEAQRSQALATFAADKAVASAGSASLSSHKTDSGLGAVVKEQALASDPVYGAVRAQESKDAAEYVAEQAGYTDSFPGIAGLRDKVALESAATKKLARDSAADHVGASASYADAVLAQRTAEASVAGDQARISAIDSTLNDIHSRLQHLSTSGVTANQIRLDRDGAANAYAQTELRLQNTLSDEAQAGALNSLTVLNYADGSAARIPSSTLAIIIAMLIVALALGSAYIAEALDPRIRSTRDVESLYGRPHIGSV